MTAPTTGGSRRKDIMPASEKEALELIRSRQLVRFFEQMASISPEEQIEPMEAFKALIEHSSTPVTITMSLETVVLLSGMLARLPQFAGCPDLIQIRLNFISAVANTVARVHPAIASVATGAIMPKQFFQTEQS